MVLIALHYKGKLLSIHIGNAIYHMLVQFSIKAQQPHCIQNCKCRLLQKNLQLCYSVILNIELHYISIVKTKILFYLFSLSSVSWLFHFLNSVSHVSLSLSLSLSYFSLSHCSLCVISPLPLISLKPPSPNNAKPKSCLDVLLWWVCVLFAPMGRGPGGGFG